MDRLLPALLIFGIAVAPSVAQTAGPKPAVEESAAAQARPDPCAETKHDGKKPAVKPSPAKQPAAATTKPR